MLQGKISRALNTTLSPIAHPLLPFPASPGQISFTEVQQILHLTGLLPSRQFYLFGVARPLQRSLSPTIYNTAFEILALPHKYEVCETESVDGVIDVLKSPSFGGASVSPPYKSEVMRFLVHVSRQARLIGAVNTITPIPGGFSGDNTEWVAIKTCLLRSITPANAITARSTALIIGAGGMARAAVYALWYIGVVNVFVWNRTKRRAEELVGAFRGLDKGGMLKVRVLDSLTEALGLPAELGIDAPTIVISTIPVTSIPSASSLPSELNVGLTPAHLSPLGGVALELSYEVRRTPLLKLAEAAPGWVGVEGWELMLEQAYEQFKIFTGRRSPMRRVKEKVMEAYRRGIEDMDVS